MRVETDFIVIGSGIAGLTYALKVAEHGRVALIVKSLRDEGATKWAQGGIAAVSSKQDSFESHMSDTHEAGAGLCQERAVEITVKEGPQRVAELINMGVPFTPSSGDAAQDFPFDLTREGGHHARRILHADDFTGQAIEDTLLGKVATHKNITVYENHVAIDLITTKKKKNNQDAAKCLGVYVLSYNPNDPYSHGPIHTFSAPITVLATGGAGKVYLYTSNPDTATGDGIAMAARAGALVANLEFMQFHPTCLFHPAAKSFLISEALRGEGGELIDDQGRSFMGHHHPMGSLAPRDIVARAIDLEMKKSGAPCMYLDMSKPVKEHGSEAVIKRFPNIHEKCLSFGIDMTKTPIPVVPAAHYTCGGVLTDEFGQTTISNLFAIGEVASTGLHGANRLASNSLLEGAVFGHRAYEKSVEIWQSLKNNAHLPTPVPLPEWDTGLATPMEDRIDINHTWKEIRTLMWNYVGIVRTDRRLEKARQRLAMINHEINEYYWRFLLNRDLIELRNLVAVAQLIVQCALLRKESRGLHFTLDYPATDDKYFKKDTII